MELPPSAHAPRSPERCESSGRRSAAPSVRDGEIKSNLSGREQHHILLGGGIYEVLVREGKTNAAEAKLV